MSKEEGYGSVETCQKLVDAGIAVETEKSWYCFTHSDHWELKDTEIVSRCGGISIPALSMYEAWRELPQGTYIKQLGSESLVWNMSEDEINDVASDLFYKDNPTDALIGLLIWLKGRKEQGGGNAGVRLLERVLNDLKGKEANHD